MIPEDIQQRDFFVGLRGYDRDEVDTFLKEIAAEHRALLDQVEELQKSEAAAVDPIVDVGHSITAILGTANAQAEEIAAQAREQAGAVCREADDEADRLRAEATQTLERANEQAARIVREAEEAAEAISADAERRGRERALERADAEVARLNEAVRRHEELRARLAEASDELSLALIAMGEPAGDAFVAVRDAILTEAVTTLDL